MKSRPSRSLSFKITALSEEDYQLQVVSTPFGLNPSFTTPISLSHELQDFQWQRADANTRQQFGTILFETLFFEAIEALYRECLARVRREKSILCLSFDLQHAAGFAHLPYELLYDTVENHYLTLLPDVTLTRFQSALVNAFPTSPHTPPYRVLVILSTPRDLPHQAPPQLQFLREMSQVQTQRGKLVVDVLTIPTLEALRKTLRHEKYHAFHFIGNAKQEGKAYVLAMTNPDDLTAEWVRVEHFVREFNAYNPIHACGLQMLGIPSGEQSRIATTIAQRMVKRGVQTVVVNDLPTPTVALEAFIQGFYGSLSEGVSPLEAAHLARQGVHLRLDREAWFSPIVYTSHTDPPTPLRINRVAIGAFLVGVIGLACLLLLIASGQPISANTESNSPENLNDELGAAVSSGSDLVLRFDTSNSVYRQGETVTISISIENQGAAAVDGLTYQIHVNNLSSFTPISGSLDRLEGNRRTAITFTYAFAESGVYMLYVELDPDNEIQEANDTNNAAAFPLIIQDE